MQSLLRSIEEFSIFFTPWINELRKNLLHWSNFMSRTNSKQKLKPFCWTVLFSTSNLWNHRMSHPMNIVKVNPILSGPKCGFVAHGVGRDSLLKNNRKLNRNQISGNWGCFMYMKQTNDIVKFSCFGQITCGKMIVDLVSICYCKIIHIWIITYLWWKKNPNDWLSYIFSGNCMQHMFMCLDSIASIAISWKRLSFRLLSNKPYEHKSMWTKLDLKKKKISST